ncbi:MAG: Maf family nucleotide pyrophosphatase [Bacteroidota bacterium]
MLRDVMSYEILLASGSPRRRELMKELEIPFRVVDTGHTDEVYPSGLAGGDIALYLAGQKSDAYADPLSDRQVLLTADTIVWHGEQELGKPANRDEAISMISRLSGTTHQVFTGVCLRSETKRTGFIAVTDVTFARFDADEVAYYVDKFKPYDKAGAYGIQEWIGHIGVERINGSYFNVMGLPVQKVYSELKAFIR